MADFFAGLVVHYETGVESFRGNRNTRLAVVESPCWE
jgi:hypothetical protein